MSKEDKGLSHLCLEGVMTDGKADMHVVDEVCNYIFSVNCACLLFCIKCMMRVSATDWEMEAQYYTETIKDTCEISILRRGLL